VGDPGQGHEFPARQYLSTKRDLVAHHRRRLQLHLERQPARQPFAHRDLGEVWVDPLAAGNGDILRSQPLLGVTPAQEVPSVLAMVCVAIACPCVAARRVVLADLGGGASARLSSSFTAEDDSYVDDRDRRHRQQDDDEANRRIDQVRPDRGGSAND
jgi:hypothetical protein